MSETILSLKNKLQDVTCSNTTYTHFKATHTHRILCFSSSSSPSLEWIFPLLVKIFLISNAIRLNLSQVFWHHMTPLLLHFLKTVILYYDYCELEL